MSDATLAVQKALVAALAGISVVGIDGGGSDDVGVYDHVPERAAMPYVVLDNHLVTPDDTLDAPLDVHVVYLSVWSQYRGTRQVLEIMQAVYDRLHNAALELESGEAVSCRVQSRTTSRDADDATFQGAVTIAIIAGHDEV